LNGYRLSGIFKFKFYVAVFNPTFLNFEPFILHYLLWAGFTFTFYLFTFALSRGGLAQLGEHNVRNVGVGGSNPLPSTTQYDPFLRFEIHGFALAA
jgi:hypothetical protein